jgi:integrase
VPIVVTLFNAAVEDELLERNPFRGLGQRTRGRSDQDPPSRGGVRRLLEACSALKGYAPTMRALITFAAYTGCGRASCSRSSGATSTSTAMRIASRGASTAAGSTTPKSNHEREVALTPPARDAILGLPRVDRLVFHAKRGGRLSQSTLSGYWAQVLARAGLDFDFYLATKHYCAHYLWVTLGLPERVVAEQLGHALDRELRWKLRSVYGHGEVGALEEIDAAFGRNVTPLRPQAVDGGADA